jgi:hypothetical protein
VSAGVAGYNIERATVSGGPYTQLNFGGPVVGTTFIDDNVSAGVEYFYTVTTVAMPDANGSQAQSAPAKEASATIPIP